GVELLDDLGQAHAAGEAQRQAVVDLDALGGLDVHDVHVEVAGGGRPINLVDARRRQGGVEGAAGRGDGHAVVAGVEVEVGGAGLPAVAEAVAAADPVAAARVPAQAGDGALDGAVEHRVGDGEVVGPAAGPQQQVVGQDVQAALLLVDAVLDGGLLV